MIKIKGKKKLQKNHIGDGIIEIKYDKNNGKKNKEKNHIGRGHTDMDKNPVVEHQKEALPDMLLWYILNHIQIINRCYNHLTSCYKGPMDNTVNYKVMQEVSIGRKVIGGEGEKIYGSLHNEKKKKKMGD
eukprot:209360_1